jgi:hypothetical protein
VDSEPAKSPNKIWTIDGLTEYHLSARWKNDYRHWVLRSSIATMLCWFIVSGPGSKIFCSWELLCKLEKIPDLGDSDYGRTHIRRSKCALIPASLHSYVYYEVSAYFYAIWKNAPFLDFDYDFSKTTFWTSRNNFLILWQTSASWWKSAVSRVNLEILWVAVHLPQWNRKTSLIACPDCQIIARKAFAGMNCHDKLTTTLFCKHSTKSRRLQCLLTSRSAVDFDGLTSYWHNQDWLA